MSQKPVAPSQLLAYLEYHGIEPAFVAPGVPMPTVSLATEAAGVPEDQILKTLVFSGEDGLFVVAITSGNDRIDRDRLAMAAGVGRLRTAAAADVFRATGFPAGGVAPLGLPPDLIVVVDRSTAELDSAYGGGGDEALLLRVRLADVIRCNTAIIADIREQTGSAA